MHKKNLILTSLFSSSLLFSHGQKVKYTDINDLQNELSIYYTGKNIFDAFEIKKEKISTAYILKTWGERDEEWHAEYRDTLFIYHFDSSGIPYEEKKLPDRYNGFEDIIIHKLNLNLNKEVPKKSAWHINKNGDSVLTSYLCYSPNDTDFIHTEIYDKYKNLILYERAASDHFLKGGNCLVGTFRKYTCQYDLLNRISKITWYSNIEGTSGKDAKWKVKSFKIISYPFYGKHIRTYSANDSLIDEEAILINNVDGTITETSREIQVTKNTYVPESSLPGMWSITELNSGPLTLFYEFVYK
ncbi:MAG: hypothetical protein ABI772_14945 [Bacteroidota bacterium]